MHDTFLIERLYKAIKCLCAEKDISLIRKTIIEVNENSRVNEESLISFFKDMNSQLVDDKTMFTIERTDLEPLIAVIKVIEGQ
ncbi:MAG: hypothetical protein QM214_06915 [Bacillota bacterium]|jgi:Zn finger protein HypA/HybF involved in hydrogenase expression|nr:hypothetical protein [Bacillota bacterium]HHU43446.1 hypothetical protein [Clostridiales bacterium]